MNPCTKKKDVEYDESDLRYILSYWNNMVDISVNKFWKVQFILEKNQKNLFLTDIGCRIFEKRF